MRADRADDLAGLHGTVITRSDPDYDQARAVYNAAVDRHPLAVVRCADAADVIACVELARERVLPLAIRGGGHHGGGFGVWDDALVIDLGGLRSSRSTRSPARCAPGPAAAGARSTAQPERSEWRRRPASSPRPGWPG